MSYILDALRRADAERGRGGVPSIHTQQQITPLGSDDDEERRPSRRAWWLAGVLGLALAAVVAWVMLRPSTAPVVAAAPAATTNASPVPSTTPATVPSTTPSASVGATTAPANAVATSSNAGTAPSVPPAVAPTTTPPRTPPAATAARKEAPPAKAPDRTARVAPRHDTGAARADANDEPAAAERVYALRELPEDVRRSLPAFTVSGSTWSADRGSRMLMIGGQIYHEGDTVAPGLALERIKPHAAVFAFRGYRYELTF